MEQIGSKQNNKISNTLGRYLTLNKDKVLLKGSIAIALAIFILIGGYCFLHWTSSAEESNLNGLAKQAADYFGCNEVYMEEIVQKGDYLAALCRDNDNKWYMCVYERDRLFGNRWCASGGKPGFKQGRMTSWNYGSPQGEAVLVFCGVNLSDEVGWYTFRNNDIIYTYPVENNTVLDIFVIPNSYDINGSPVMLDENKQPLE